MKNSVLACFALAASSVLGIEHSLKLTGGEKPDILFQVALLGEAVKISAPENPSTGFMWQI